MEKLIEAFAEGLNIPPQNVAEDLKYNEIPEWDSVSHMALVASLEEKFNVSLDVDEVIDMSSFNKVKEILEKHGIKF